MVRVEIRNDLEAAREGDDLALEVTLKNTGMISETEGENGQVRLERLERLNTRNHVYLRTQRGRGASTYFWSRIPTS